MEIETMKIVYFPHPALRHKSKPIKRVDGDLRTVVRKMFDLMYEARGVGLAANQVDLPIRLFVVNLEADPTKGQEMGFINPVIGKPKGSEEAEEGCLSLPELYGPVIRPKEVAINAYNLAGEEVNARVDGLFARVLQHETDHLDGVMFTDRMSATAVADARPALDEFEFQFQRQQERGEIESDAAIADRLHEWETRYC